MKLSYLIYFHHVIYVAAMLAALFVGMVLQYNIKQAEQRGMIKVYTTMSIQGLGEVGI